MPRDASNVAAALFSEIQAYYTTKGRAMDNAFLQWAISQAGLGGIAALALWLNNKQAQDALRRERETSEQMRSLNTEVLTTLKDVTKALTALEGAIDGLTRAERHPATANRQ